MAFKDQACFLPQAGGFYVLIAWGFHQKSESASSGSVSRAVTSVAFGIVPVPAPSRLPGTAQLETKWARQGKLMLLRGKVIHENT